MMNISLLVSNDMYSHKIRDNIFPLAIKALEGITSLDYESHKTLLSKLKYKIDYPHEQNVLLSLSFDAKTCGMPIGVCPGNSFDLCKDCCYNPLTALLDPQLSSSSCVITDRRTIELLFDIINLLIKANKYALIRESISKDNIDDWH